MGGVRTRSQTRRAVQAVAASAAPAAVMEHESNESACNSLPVEVLTDILHRVAKKDFKDLFRAQQVCCLWRHASYAVPELEWCVSSQHAGSALLQFLKSRRQSGVASMRLNSVGICFTKTGLASAPLRPIMTSLAEFTIQDCKIVGPEPQWYEEGWRGRGQRDEAEAEAAVKGLVELFKCISRLNSVETLRLEHFGDVDESASIWEPLPVPFVFLRVLILKYCCLKRKVLEQLINTSPNLEEARWEGGHYEEEDRSESPSCLHIRSKSLRYLYVEQSYCGPAETSLELDAPNLTSLHVDYYEDLAILRTPKLVELTMRSVDRIDTAPLKDLRELTFQGYCHTFEPQVPNILRCTSHLLKLCINPECEEHLAYQLLDLDTLLPELPATITYLEVGWDFLRSLKMGQASRIVNRSVVELVVSQYYELDGKSELRNLKRRLRLLRKAFLGVRKVFIGHLNSCLGYEAIQSTIDCFADIDYVEVESDGWTTFRELGISED